MNSTYLRLLLLSLLVVVCFSDGGKDDLSPCEKVKKPNSPEQCKGLTPENPDLETCCYLVGEVDGEDYKSECLDMKKADSTNKEGLERIISGIMKGNYWEGEFARYLEVDKLTCFNGDIKVSYESSECELVENPDGLSKCEGKKTSDDNEKCCYLNAKQGDDEGGECVDIKKDDDPEKIRDKIKNGEYWGNYPLTYDKINDLKCPDDKSSSSYLATGILMFLLAFL